ncbi:uncharacterized protein LOC113357217 [Papaver somniferum]|uniref:uncharacterized protein LOC113357217 n=1 Tax=Papaver somniferum TaxID=3469 RepID=UPI000E6FEC40|nr:uncharacterized protein LOC113357217 [Papaver somniferum]XP_026456343.1 uncharacterized protein LOC113357217 [Papaver somniferum]
MLLTVEGGGFFSSSASGYRNGLALIFLGQQQNQGEVPLQLSTSWTSRYKLIQQEEAAYLELQLASKKNCVSSRRCTSFVCFCPSSTGLEPPSPPVQYKYGCSVNCPVSYQNVNYITDQENEVFYLKSSLRKPSDHHAPTASEDDMGQNGNSLLESSGAKKVHWTDACGKELAEIREFEVSDESASDSEEESRRGCTCAIM